MKILKRSITDDERRRAFDHVAPNEKYSPLTIHTLLVTFGYRELEEAKECVAQSPHSLTIGDMYTIWNALSSALDHHDGSDDLKELEAHCAFIVTEAWDREMAISDNECIIRLAPEKINIEE